MAGCSGYEPGERLARIGQLSEESPLEALDSLASIGHGSLSEADRHYCDLLSVIAMDRAYIGHKSDSLILDVIDYFSSHKSKSVYPLALYYGGRVYSDIGDYPTALRHFQDALDELEECETNPDLKANILSQTGRLLSNIRLYDEAIPYISEAIDISKSLNDTFGIAYDYQQLAHLYTNMENYNLARKNNDEATRWAAHLKKADQADMLTNLAYILHREGKNDSSLIVVRDLPSIVDSVSLNYTKAIASGIYLDAGIIDTAYIYALELVASGDPVHSKAGFEILFSPELKAIAPIDTLQKYSSNYALFMENYLDSRVSQQAIIQNSSFNYQMHVRMRKKAEEERETMLHTLLIVFCILVVVTIIFLFLCLRYIKQKERLRMTLSKIQSIMSEEELSTSPESVEQLKHKISTTLSKIGKTNPPVTKEILDSPVYWNLQELVKKKSPISKELWEEIESLVKKVSPLFIPRLYTLAKGKLTRYDVEIALLIRMGFSVTEMHELLCLTKSAISTRRRRLIEKLFDNKVEIEYLDSIIRIL